MGQKAKQQKPKNNQQKSNQQKSKQQRAKSKKQRAKKETPLGMLQPCFESPWRILRQKATFSLYSQSMVEEVLEKTTVNPQQSAFGL